MIITLDTEFYEEPGTIELISIGLVAENGHTFYAENTGYDRWAPGRDVVWLAEHVYPTLKRDKWMKTHNHKQEALECCGNISTIRKYMVEWINKTTTEPEFWAWYADYDWVVFCWMFGRMIDLPGNFPMYCRDYKQECDRWGAQVNVKLPEGTEHNALADAQALMDTMRKHSPQLFTLPVNM